MKKKIISIAMSIVLAFGTGAASFAHSGRTDSSGGHRDNKNASGLGSYHYHCGGHPAHLHKNGVCPYTGGGSSGNSSSKSSSSSRTSKSSGSVFVVKATPAPAPVYTYLSMGNVHTFMNGYEMPTFQHSKLNTSCIIVEDLKDYGFDVEWNADTQTLTVIKNNEKVLAPISMNYYNSLPLGYHLFKINETSNTKILFKNQSGDAGYIPVSYDCNGYMAVPIDELKAFTDNWGWNPDSRTLWLYTR